MSVVSGEIEPAPVTLTGRVARLEPLALEHAAGLFAIGAEETIWTWLSRPPLESLEDARGFIFKALKAAEARTEVPFAIVDVASGRVAGSTRYLTILRKDRSLEIGWTWLGTDFQRTALNTECKYLLLRHAFEDLGCVRVQFKTDERNQRSQAAIARIGAVREGVLRKYQITRGDIHRNTVMFSITDGEWPGVRQRLIAMMRREGKGAS